MECAKNIGISLKEGQVSKKGFITKIAKKITNHKIITTIVLATIGFMVLDIMLISSFVSILGRI